MSERYLGQIILLGGRFVIKKFAECNGQLLDVRSNQLLFSLLSNHYGGDGNISFALPDLRGRGAIHYGDGPLGSFRLGEKGGHLSHQLNINQMPAHTHSFKLPASSKPADADSPQNQVPAMTESPVYHSTPNGIMSEGKTGMAGGANPFSIESPNLAMNYQICLDGIFPGRS